MWRASRCHRSDTWEGKERREEDWGGSASDDSCSSKRKSQPGHLRASEERRMPAGGPHVERPGPALVPSPHPSPPVLSQCLRAASPVVRFWEHCSGFPGQHSWRLSASHPPHQEEVKGEPSSTHPSAAQDRNYVG